MVICLVKNLIWNRRLFHVSTFRKRNEHLLCCSKKFDNEQLVLHDASKHARKPEGVQPGNCPPPEISKPCVFVKYKNNYDHFSPSPKNISQLQPCIEIFIIFFCLSKIRTNVLCTEKQRDIL